MVFSSLIFIIRFLPAVLFLYAIVPGRFKNTVLFLSSIIFYSWGEVHYFPVMCFLILANYVSGIMIERGKNDYMRKVWLLIAILCSLGTLIWYKYSAFIGNIIFSLTGIKPAFLPDVRVLPLGISFYTFQTMSYSIDVYREQTPAEYNLIDFGAYVAMFPQLIAGPIVKYREISRQLKSRKSRFDAEKAERGVTRFVFGLSEKVILADGISHLWTDIIGVYQNGVEITAGVGLLNVSTPLAWLGILAYSLQLYFDFSGYSQMAIGLGLMLGFDFPENFNFPYISGSITEFWRRWHMTLSLWFREYVYIPLGGNRHGLKKQIRNMLTVWILTGIWHGADWNFVLWGLYYFLILMVEKLFLSKTLERHKVFAHVFTLFLIVVGWALFVGNEPGVGLANLFGKLFLWSDGIGISYFIRNYGVLFLICVLFCTPVPLSLWYSVIKTNRYLRTAAVIILLAVSVSFITGSTNSPFLYFNF